MVDLRWSRYSPEQKLARSKAVNKCRKNRHKKLKELFGGKCNVCGYARCFRALEFHHLDPRQKKFGVSVSGNTRSWKALLEEAKKCVLLCANCHREVEDGMTKVFTAASAGM